MNMGNLWIEDRKVSGYVAALAVIAEGLHIGMITELPNTR